MINIAHNFMKHSGSIGLKISATDKSKYESIFKCQGLNVIGIFEKGVINRSSDFLVNSFMSLRRHLLSTSSLVFDDSNRLLSTLKNAN